MHLTSILNTNTGCRLPGEVKSAADLWDLLKDEKSGHGKVPKERWNIDAFHHENGGEKIGSMSMVCSDHFRITCLSVPFLKSRDTFRSFCLILSPISLF